MTAVTRSASVSITQLLGTVGTAANALTTTFSAINHAADVIAATSEDWSVRTREKIAHDRINMSEEIRDEAAIKLAQRVVDREAMLAKSPELKAAYEKALEVFASKLDKPQS